LLNSFLRLEERLSDIEIEDQMLHQQALLNSPVRKMSEHLAITTPLQNGHHVSGKNKASESYFYILFNYCYLPLLYIPEGVYFLQEPQSAAPAKKLVQSL
jgi:hypothetical protein